MRNSLIMFGEPRWGRTNDHLIKSGTLSNSIEAEKKLTSIRKDIKALDRVLKNPLSQQTRNELSERLEWIREVLSQGAIPITSQQETALRCLSHEDNLAAPLIHDYVLVRKAGRQDQTYKHAFLIIIVQLLTRHASNNVHGGISYIRGISAKIANAIFPPNIKIPFTERTAEYADKGQ